MRKDKKLKSLSQIAGLLAIVSLEVTSLLAMEGAFREAFWPGLFGLVVVCAWFYLRGEHARAARNLRDEQIRDAQMA